MSKRPKQASKQSPVTPIRAALQVRSSLHALVKDGLGAIKRTHRSYFDENVRSCFADSIDIDEAFRVGKEQENRWDYLLGVNESRKLVGIEPHSAKEDEISTVIKKVKAARIQLRDHLKERVIIHTWIWVASGKVHFLDIDKESLRLNQSGILFAGRKVNLKHIK
jgi:hypothetical protein